jgi:malonyl CoA-acyl carrier protein transacylase
VIAGCEKALKKADADLKKATDAAKKAAAPKKPPKKKK